MFEILETAGFSAVRSTVVPGFRFRDAKTRRVGEGYGVKAVLFTARKPE